MKKITFWIVYLAFVLSVSLQAHPSQEIYLHCNMDEAIALINPENEIERNVISDTEWIEGARWGVPRNGHPEGAIIYHIHEIFQNIENDYAHSPMREKLRILAIIHDTFKYKVDESLPKDGENQHGMIARRFAEKYLSDQRLLEIIQRHDEAYFAWQFGAKNGDWNKALQSVYDLIALLGDHLELFIAFYKCDNRTGDKTPDDVEWFEEIALALH